MPVKSTTGLGIIYDTITVNEFQNINDLNLYLGIDDDIISELEVTLISPSGDSVLVYDNNTTISGSANNNISCVLDDQSDSTMASGRFSSFTNTTRPLNSLNAKFSGENSQGKWILKMEDNVSGNSGTIYGWGVQFNNSAASRVNMEVKSLIQGFYDANTNLQVPDTNSVCFANIDSPYNILDSSVTILSSGGSGLYSVNRNLFGTSFYVVLRHRNSLETWSSQTSNLFDFNRQYTFFDSKDRALGDNQIQVDASPGRFAAIGGDENQDGNVVVSDIIAVFNDDNNFAAGYLSTDMTGDDFVDVADLVLTFKNSNNFVSVIKP